MGDYDGLDGSYVLPNTAPEPDHCNAEPRPPTRRGWDEPYIDTQVEQNQEWRRTSLVLDQLAAAMREHSGAHFVLVEDNYPDTQGAPGWVARMVVGPGRGFAGRGDYPIDAIERLLAVLK
jgi:hypothetical protein